MNHPNEKIDLQKLSGNWYSIFENYVRQTHTDCVVMNLKPVEGSTTKLHCQQGISFKDDDLVLLDDHKIFEFGNNVDTTMAAVHVIEELHGEIKDAETLLKVDSLNLPEIDEEKRKKMDIGDFDLYSRKRDELSLTKDSILDGIANKNRYYDPWRVIDTDYNNFLITY